MNKRQSVAEANREELMQAALEIFQVHGINAPLQLIIDQAQVGRATFYRNFVDRKALIIALMHQALARLQVSASYYQQYPDGLIRLIQDHIYNLPYLTALMEYWRVIDIQDPALIEIYQLRNAVLQPLIDQAITHGVCRSDFNSSDYTLITATLRAALQGHTPSEQQKIAKRAVELLLDGIRA